MLINCVTRRVCYLFMPFASASPCIFRVTHPRDYDGKIGLKCVAHTNQIVIECVKKLAISLKFSAVGAHKIVLSHTLGVWSAFVFVFCFPRLPFLRTARCVFYSFYSFAHFYGCFLFYQTHSVVKTIRRKIFNSLNLIPQSYVKFYYI